MIYDQPNHPQYGPVRRVHLILLYLFGDRLPVIEALFIEKFRQTWDGKLAAEVAVKPVCEQIEAQEIIREMLDLA